MATPSQTTQRTTHDSHHTRSRTGCLTCRVRNKKCDEPGEYMICKECNKFHLECVKTSGPLSLPNDVKYSPYGKACVEEAKAAVAARRRDNDEKELPGIRRLAQWLSSFSDLQLDGSQHGMSPITSSPSPGLFSPQTPQALPVEDVSYPEGSSQSSTVYIANQIPVMSVMGGGHYGSSNASITYTAQAPDPITSQVIERIKIQVLPMYAEILGARVEPAGTLHAAPAHPVTANPDPNVPFFDESHHHGSYPEDVIQILKEALEFAANAVGLQVLDDDVHI